MITPHNSEPNEPTRTDHNKVCAFIHLPFHRLVFFVVM